MADGTSALKGGAVLFSEMTPPDGEEGHFNDWYDNHHMPSHVYGVPGFRSGQRYKNGDRPDYLAIYELESPATLTDEEYRTRKYQPDAPTKAMLSRVTAFTRYIGEEIFFLAQDEMTMDVALDADFVLGAFLRVPPERGTEFEEWYAAEHTPMLLKNPRWRLARHMRIVDANPDPYTHLFIHYVDDLSVLESPEVAAARATDWRNRLAREDWFKPHLVHYNRRGKRYHKGEPEAATFKLEI